MKKLVQRNVYFFASITNCYYYVDHCSIKAYFRRLAETRRAENISAQLGSVCHASALDQENIAMLKQLY